MKRLRNLSRKFKLEIEIYKLILKDKRTPFMGKLFLGLAVGYLLLPFDLIPDFIPVLGQLDDLVIVPLLVLLALSLIPDYLISEHRKRLNNSTTNNI